MEPRFNHNLLLIGRQTRGLSQVALAQRADVTQGHLSKMENGLSEPSEEVLKRLADALDFPESFFSQPDRVYGLPVSVHPMHRKKAQVGQRVLERIHAELNIRLMHFRRLVQAVELTPEFPMPQLDIDEYDEDAEKIAELVRRTWLLPRGPLQNLTECLERAGSLVVWCDFSGAAIDAVTLSVPGMPPCVFLNRDQPADRMRFSLAHELGHLVMHRIPTREMEVQANEFASAFLMPDEDIRGSFRGRVTLPRLASLKRVWRVSIQSLLMRAKAIGAISANQSRYLWQQISVKKIRFREPPELDFAHEEPGLLPTILKLHLEQLGYSVAELAIALHTQEPELRRMYGLLGNSLQDGHLRVVS